MDTELLEYRIENSVFGNSENLKTRSPKLSQNLSSAQTVSSSFTAGETLHYGKFYFSGLKKGQGITVANALRRVLLYDIFGIGITKVKFCLNNSLIESGGSPENIRVHEFLTISGMKESILEFLINLRSVIWTKPNHTEIGNFVPSQGGTPTFGESNCSFSRKFILKDVIHSFRNSENQKTTSSMNFNRVFSESLPEVFVLQAKHLESVGVAIAGGERSGGSGVSPFPSTPPRFDPQIVNPEQYLATFVSLKKNVKTREAEGESLDTAFPNFEMDFEVHGGSFETGVRGHSHPPQQNDFVVDPGPFFPIKKVNYSVELEKTSTKHFDQGQSSHECVFFEIWTDGSIHPEKALKKAFSILESLFKDQKGGGVPPPL